MPNTVVGVIGGTGLYSIPGLTISKTIEVSTPFGAPSSPVSVANITGTEVLFIARHGIGHRILPSELNARANIFALKSLGAEWCVSVSAVGSLREELHPGQMVVPDQLIDRTRGRPNTFFGEGMVAHVSFADPFCPALSEVLVEAAERVSPHGVHRGGTYVCMEGPAFSTRAESHLYRSWGGDLIGMTALPEAKLAREAELSYAILAMVTDYDSWRPHDEGVGVDEIMRVLHENSSTAGEILLRAIPMLKHRERPPFVRDALKTAILTSYDRIPQETIRRLQPLIRRYIPSSEEVQ